MVFRGGGVRLSSAEAKALDADDLPMRSLGLWHQIVAKVAGGFHRLLSGGIVGVGFGYVAEVVEVDGHCIGGAVVLVKALASIPANEGSRHCTGAS
jgi:hypothetical protein